MRGIRGGRGGKHVLHIMRTCTGSLEEMTGPNLWVLGASRILHCVIKALAEFLSARLSCLHCHMAHLCTKEDVSKAATGVLWKPFMAGADACCSFRTCCAAASSGSSSSSSGRGVLAACCSSSSRGRALPALLSCATPLGLRVYCAAYDHLQKGNLRNLLQEIDILCHVPRHAISLPQPVTQHPCLGCYAPFLHIIRGSASTADRQQMSVHHLPGGWHS